ncbi:metal transporter, partial [Thermodesulfobacteriota bacterium]
IYDRTDLPVDITQMSFDSYTIPVTKGGDLPFKLFGRKLNFGYLREKNIKFQICYAAKDDLVDAPSALAPQDFVDVELVEFPKGHAAIATSWSHPDTEYALHKEYSNGQRGPVRLQLDLDKELRRLGQQGT